MPTPDPFGTLDAAIAKAATPQERAALLVQVAARLAALGAGMVETASATAPAEDQQLSVQQAAARIGVSTSYVYHNAKRLPGVARIGRRLVISARACDRLLERNRT
ncbi:MAG TPA: helix-turn-helix domain-containing protein [Vicinamibacteria bacterium]|nr:helix-turn-helix domain-containing protein [Vicinamibacteria bacterium]